MRRRTQKGQTEIVATIVIMGLVVAAIAFAYLWGVPLFTKSGDVTLLAYVQDVFERLGTEVSDVAKEGGQRTVELRIEKGQVSLELDEVGEYIFVFTTNTPVSFFPPEGAPINDWTLPYQDRVDEINFTQAYNATMRAGNKTIDGDSYSFYAYDTQGDTTYDCVLKSVLGGEPSGECFEVGGLITPAFRLDYLDPDGQFATLLDGITTSVGLVGKDKSGVVVGKAEKVGSRFKTTIYLKMRELFDPGKSDRLKIELVPKAGSTIRASGSFSITMRNAGQRVEYQDDVLYRVTTVEVEIT